MVAFEKHINDGTHELNLIQKNFTKQSVYIGSHEGVLISFSYSRYSNKNKHKNVTTDCLIIPILLQSR